MNRPPFKYEDKKDMINQPQLQTTQPQTQVPVAPSMYYYSPFTAANTHQIPGQYFQGYPHYPMHMHPVPNTFPTPYPPAFHPGYIPVQYNNNHQNQMNSQIYSTLPSQQHSQPSLHTPTQSSQSKKVVISKPQTQARTAASAVSNVRPIKKQQTPSTHQTSFKYNLDDPVELEKWKAERRKKFPTVQTTAEVVKSASEVAENKKIKLTAANREEKEEGEADDDDEEEADTEINKQDTLNMDVGTDEDVAENQDIIEGDNPSDIKQHPNPKRACKYFAKGKCRHGDACKFSHQSKTHSNTKNTPATRPTIFENLLKIEENEAMLKFYECIKIISASASAIKLK